MKKVSSLKAIVLFSLFTVYFFVLLYTLIPYLKANYSLNPALHWFITGYFLFVPMAIYSVVAVHKEGNSTVRSVLAALNVKTMSKKDLLYSVGGLVLVFVLSGIIFALSGLLSRFYGIRELSTTPWFMEMNPFQGREKLLLLVWLPMFFFNICGEELLWRGYIQTRLQGKYAWLLCSLLWLMFHLPFGIDLMIMLIPVSLIIPFVYSKTHNTLTGIFIHGIYNGPIFIMVALGLMG